VSRSDDLDVLERELGPALRVALRDAAARAVDESQEPPRLPPGATVRGAPIGDVITVHDDGADETVVELEARLDARARYRRRLVAIAAAAFALIVGSALTYAVWHDERAGVQTQPGPSSTTMPASPVSVAVLPSEGAPASAPKTGRLIAGVDFWGIGESIDVYADGRVIRYLRGFGPAGSGPADDVPGGVSEQRLTPEGAERVRSTLLASGLFGAGRPAAGQIGTACSCNFRVRAGGDLLGTGTLPPGQNAADREVQAKVDQLVEFVTHLDSALPPSVWADSRVQAYVPSAYRACIVTGQHAPQVLPNASAFIAREFPGPVSQILAGIETCIDVTPRDARVLARRLPIDTSGSGSGFVANIRDTLTAVTVQPVLPSGGPPVAFFD
jgi:hypothetical protein